MYKLLAIAAVATGCASLGGCATIVHGGPRSVTIASTPAGAHVSIYDRSNNLVLSNTTPFIAQLKPGAGYFRGQTYRLVFELQGHSSAEVNLKPVVSGWYAGNLLFGGIIGLLIVDPLTGAMYNLTPDKIEQPLSASQAEVIRTGKGVLVVLASQLTEGELNAMTRIE